MIISAIPPALTVVTGIAGSLAAGRILADLLLPAELFFLALPGMLLVTAAAIKRNFLKGLTVVLLCVEAGTLALCQGVAVISGIASGFRPAQGLLWYVLIGLLICYDLVAAAAPFAGLAVFRKCR